MTIEEIVNELRASIDEIENDIAYEYDIEETKPVHIEVTIDGYSHDLSSDVLHSISKAFTDYADSTVRDALEHLRYLAEELEKLASSDEEKADEKPVETPGEDRRAKYGGERGDAPDAADYPKLYKPPSGFEWAEEFREPTTGEWFVCDVGGPLQSSGGDYSPRPILRKLEESAASAPKREPWPGSDVAKASDPITEDFTDRYEPPTGFAWTGEYRPWRRGDTFLNKNGKVERAESREGSDIEQRHILKATFAVPLRPGYYRSVPAAPAATPPEPPPTPAKTSFAPPKLPDPV